MSRRRKGNTSFEFLSVAHREQCLYTKKSSTPKDTNKTTITQEASRTTPQSSSYASLVDISNTRSLTGYNNHRLFMVCRYHDFICSRPLHQARKDNKTTHSCYIRTIRLSPKSQEAPRTAPKSSAYASLVVDASINPRSLSGFNKLRLFKC
jgi:hypothetical protein